MVKTRNQQQQGLVNTALFSNDIVFKFASYLSPNDMVSLALSSRKYVSLVEEAARRQFQEIATGAERNVLPRYDGESWIALYRQLEIMRSPLFFDYLVGCEIGYDGRDKSRLTVEPLAPEYNYNSALANQVMRGGKHFATFRFYTGTNVGIIRPIQRWDEDGYGGGEEGWGLHYFSPMQLVFHEKLLAERTDRWGESNTHWCVYSSHDGLRCSCDWENVPGIAENWDSGTGRANVLLRERAHIGLLLDLDEGTLTVYKDGRRLGVIQDGLTGEYCWFTEIPCEAGGEVTISRGEPPAA